MLGREFIERQIQRRLWEKFLEDSNTQEEVLWEVDGYLLRGSNIHDHAEWVWWPRTEPYKA